MVRHESLWSMMIVVCSREQVEKSSVGGGRVEDVEIFIWIMDKTSIRGTLQVEHFGDKVRGARLGWL